jgi:hypothetical protein
VVTVFLKEKTMPESTRFFWGVQTNFSGLLVGPTPKSFQVASCIDESMVGIVFLQFLCGSVDGVSLGNRTKMKLHSLISQKYSLVF